MPKRVEHLSIDNLSIKVLRAESRLLHLLRVEKTEARAVQACEGGPK